ncbi:MAG: hypothetical protein Kow0098_07470 [Ignavibacteriaceae bacterium]
MKKLCLVILLFNFYQSASAQFDLRVSMGIDFVNTPSLVDYINNYYLSGSDLLGDFNSAVNFSGETDYFFSENFHIGIEIAYLLNSFTQTYPEGQYELNYGIIMPSVLAYYVFSGEGYNFKFGGGVGIRFVNADESLPATGTTISYSSTGPGFILRALGNTALSENLYATIGADLRYDLNGEPMNGDKPLGNSEQIPATDFNSLSAGVKLGVTFTF